jgi:hypothetical protein
VVPPHAANMNSGARMPSAPPFTDGPRQARQQAYPRLATVPVEPRLRLAPRKSRVRARQASDGASRRSPPHPAARVSGKPRMAGGGQCGHPLERLHPPGMAVALQLAGHYSSLALYGHPSGRHAGLAATVSHA